MSSWDPDLHPRDRDGRFGSKGAGALSRVLADAQPKRGRLAGVDNRERPLHVGDQVTVLVGARKGQVGTVAGKGRYGGVKVRFGSDQPVNMSPANIQSRAAQRKASQQADDAIRHAAGRTPQQHPTRAPAAAPAPEPSMFAERFHRDLNGIEDLAQAVEAGPPINRRPLTGGESADTELHTLQDGRKVVWKSGGNPDAEQASSMIARALGLNAPRVYRNQDSAIYMDYVDNAMTAAELQDLHPDEWNKRQRAAADHDDGQLIGLLDALTGNIDRNLGNWMLTPDGHTIPIDHGHTFMSTPPGPVRTVNTWGPFGELYTGGPNPLTDADIPVIRQRLEALAPDFAKIGRSDWLQYSLGVLDLLAKNTGGYINVVAEGPS